MVRSGRSGLVTLIVAVFLASVTSVWGQGTGSIRLDGLLPVGGRSSVTESWGTLQFALTNLDRTPREMRVVVFYPEEPFKQYGRDVSVPGASQLTTWIPIGPVPAQPSTIGRELKFLLYDRTGGESRLLNPTGDERLRSRAVLYKKREPTTVLIADNQSTGIDIPDPTTVSGTSAEQALILARTFRHARGLSESVSVNPNQLLPPATESLDGVDLVVLAGNRLTADPVGCRVLRHWVQQGGTLWVLLDLVDPSTVAPILGDFLGFEVVGRTSLSAIGLRQPGEPTAKFEVREYDQPVPFVRVSLDGSETVLYETDGWPAAFSRAIGRGKVVFTTLGGRGWYRPRMPRDPRSRFENYPDLPIPWPQLERLAVELYPEPELGGFQPSNLAQLLKSEIGYSVISQKTVALILGGFAASLLVLGWLVRRTGQSAALGWLIPVVALGVAGLLTTLGTDRRQAVPPTNGTAVVLDVAPGNEEAAANGMFAVYRPNAGPAGLASIHGGNVDLDLAGLDGQTFRRIQSDLDAWHWEDLALPVGVRLGQLRTTVRTGRVSAVARFGPTGLEGKLTTGNFKNLADLIMLTPAREAVGVRLAADGSFTSGLADALPEDQFLTGAVLSDRQQRQQEVYRRLLARPRPRHMDGGNTLLAWADLVDPPIATEAGDRTIGAALLAIPVTFERSVAGSRVTIPPGFLPFTAVVEGKPVRPTMEATSPARMRLRFRLPQSALPMTIERATIQVRVRAPSRKVTVAGYADGQTVTLSEVESPIGPILVNVTDARMLQPDADGYLFLGLNVSERPGTGIAGVLQDDLDERWKIESIALEVVGQAGE